MWPEDPDLAALRLAMTIGLPEATTPDMATEVEDTEMTFMMVEGRVQLADTETTKGISDQRGATRAEAPVTTLLEAAASAGLPTEVGAWAESTATQLAATHIKARGTENDGLIYDDTEQVDCLK